VEELVVVASWPGAANISVSSKGGVWEQLHQSCTATGPLALRKAASVRDHISKLWKSRRGQFSYVADAVLTLHPPRLLKHQFLDSAVSISVYLHCPSILQIGYSDVRQFEADAALTVRNPHPDLDRERRKARAPIQLLDSRFFLLESSTRCQHAFGCEGMCYCG